LGEFRDGTYESSLSGQGFLRLMKHLKEVFLQDSIFLPERWLNCSNFQQPLFRSAEYADFAKKKVLAACRDPQVSYNQEAWSPNLRWNSSHCGGECTATWRYSLLRRDWQLGHQHELRQLTGLAGILHLPG
jgi:hypothetical protein